MLAKELNFRNFRVAVCLEKRKSNVSNIFVEIFVRHFLVTKYFFDGKIDASAILRCFIFYFSFLKIIS